MTGAKPSLPAAFIENMRRDLGNEADAFFAALEMPFSAALRLNPARKFDPRAFAGERVPWESSGFYIYEGARPGASIAHFAGAFYVQEASAMLPVAVLDPRAGEVVLDLCAAPGGKSTQIAALMGGAGALVANEIDARRARVLFSNIERMGVKNAAVTNESPDRLADKLAGAFDAVLVDAPCSGEGMFRRDADARAEWNAASPEGCAARQRQILDCAARLVKDGGRLVYSTCTYNRTENDENAEWFARTHPEFSPRDFDMPAVGKSENGKARILPHRVNGDGQFCALFVKSGAHKPSQPVRASQKCDAFARFSDEFAMPAAEGFSPFTRGDTLYLKSDFMPELSGLRVVSPGLALAKIMPTRAGIRLEPEHSCAMTGEFSGVELDSQAARAFIRGEEIPCSETGWRVANFGGMPLGWGKASGGALKNRLPKGLRREIYSEE